MNNYVVIKKNICPVPILGAIFDVDGTILDSMQMWEHAGEEFLKVNGLVPKDGLRDKLLAMSLNQTANYFIKEYGMKDSCQKIMNDFNNFVKKFYFKSVCAKNEVAQMLAKLKDSGIEMCAATATDRQLVEAGLKRNGILRFFDNIFTCADLKTSKDSPYIYEKALESLGTSKENTYVFEDAFYAISTAKKAGFPVISVYDSSADAQRHEILRICDANINSWEEFDIILS